MSSQYPEYFTLVSNPTELKSAFQAGRFSALLAIEGLHQIGNLASVLRLYSTLGVKYASLTWNCHNAFADSALVEIDSPDGSESVSTPATPYWGGVSPAGRKMIAEMNRLGMIVDLSHASVDTMRQVLEGSGHGRTRWNGSKAPPIFSHSSAYALCPHPRNVPDDVLHMVKRRKSLVMVNFSPNFLSCVPNEEFPWKLPKPYAPNSTLAQVVKHIMYIGDLIGYDHVGLGSDFDGIDTGPKDLEDISKFPDLVSALLENGVSQEDCRKIIGENLLRVWEEVLDISRQLQHSILPLEDEMAEPW